MPISDRLNNFRQLLPGVRSPQEDERLLQLYWNRAELKKELVRVQDERRREQEHLRTLEGAVMRTREELQALEHYLGDPDAGAHALVYFQLQALWRTCAAKLARFSGQLQQQQMDREQRRTQIEFDQTRRRELADCDRRIEDAHAAVATLEAELKLMEAKLAALRGFWNYFRRRTLGDEIEAARGRWDLAVMQVTDLSDDRAHIEASPSPPFAGLSVDGRRVVNTAIIAYAQQWVASLSKGGVAILAKETTTKRVFDVQYGSREDCARLMVTLKDALALVQDPTEDLRGLKERTDAVRESAIYRSDADTIPLTDSIGVLPTGAAPVSGLESVGRAGVNVLVDDYWDLYQALLQ